MGAAASVSGDDPHHPALQALLANRDLWAVSVRPDGSLVHTPLPGNPAPLLVTPARPGKGSSTRGAPLPALRPSSARPARRPTSAVPPPARPTSAAPIMRTQSFSLDESSPAGQVGPPRPALCPSLPEVQDPYQALSRFLKTDPSQPEPGDECVCSTPSVGCSASRGLPFADVHQAAGWHTHVQHILVQWDDSGLLGYQLTLFGGDVYERGTTSAVGCPLVDFTFQADEMLSSMSFREYQNGSTCCARSVQFTTSYGNTFDAGPTDFTSQVHVPVAGTFLKGFHGSVQDEANGGDVCILSLGAYTSSRNLRPIIQPVISFWADGAVSPSGSAEASRVAVVRVAGSSAAHLAVCLADPCSPPLEVLVNDTWVQLQSYPAWTTAPCQDDQQLRLALSSVRHLRSRDDDEVVVVACPKLRLTVAKATLQGSELDFSESLSALSMLSVAVSPADLTDQGTTFC